MHRACCLALILAACGPRPRPAASSPSGPPGEGAASWESDPTAPPAAAPPSASPPRRAPTTSSTAAPAAPTSEAQALVAAHNRVRAQHCAAPLTWSTKLAGIAQHWANTLRDKGCAFEHSGGDTGENLAAGTSGMMDPDAVVAMWADEVKLYSFSKPGFSMETGHFTQVVWRGTTQVGCGKAVCNGMDLWVCEYDPAGNWEGQYREQVLPTGCRR